MINRKTKILYIHQYFSLPSGSSGIRSYKNALALTKVGFEVTIICINDGRNSLKNSLKKNWYQNVGEYEGIKIIQLNIDYSNYMNLLIDPWFS